jgi:hypothetical protein
LIGEVEAFFGDFAGEAQPAMSASARERTVGGSFCEILVRSFQRRAIELLHFPKTRVTSGWFRSSIQVMPIIIRNNQSLPYKSAHLQSPDNATESSELPRAMHRTCRTICVVVDFIR